MKKEYWLLDEEHSSIVFKVKHMVISTVMGHFPRFQVNATIEDSDVKKGSIECIIYPKDVTTNDKYRDNHLVSPELFDVERYQEIRFISEDFRRTAKEFRLKGELTIKDITKTIEIPVTFLGKNKVNNIERAAFESNFVINRDDFNLTYTPLIESGGMVLGNEVSLSVHVTLINKQV
ncbi:MAG: YceI family protein [Sphingobacterium sp.]